MGSNPSLYCTRLLCPRPADAEPEDFSAEWPTWPKTQGMTNREKPDLVQQQSVVDKVGNGEGEGLRCECGRLFRPGAGRCPCGKKHPGRVSINLKPAEIAEAAKPETEETASAPP